MAVYFLVLLYFVAIGKPVFPIAGYWLNKDYIAQNLCVQKDIEENECQGQCHLQEEISKARDDDSRDIPVSKLLKIDLEYYCHFVHQIQLEFNGNSKPEKHKAAYIHFFKNPYSDTCFQPPEYA